MIHRRLHRWMVIASCGALTVALAAGCSSETSGQAIGEPSARATAETTQMPTSPTPRSTATKGSSPDPKQSASASPANPESPTNSELPTPDPQSSADPAKTPVPPPTPGSVKETVKPQRQKTRAPVEMDETATVTSRLTVEVTNVKSIKNPKTGMPSELAGPAVAVTLRLDNETGDDIDLTNVVVEVSDSTGAPGNRLTGDPYQPFAGQVASGKTVNGVYVYAVNEDLRDPVTVTMTLSADRPIVLFRGKV